MKIKVHFTIGFCKNIIIRNAARCLELVEDAVDGGMGIGGAGGNRRNISKGTGSDLDMRRVKRWEDQMTEITEQNQRILGMLEKQQMYR